MSGWYLAGKEGLFARTIAAATPVYVAGVNDSYVFNSAHTELADIGTNIILPEQALTGVTYVDGALDAEDVTWVNAAAPAEGVSDQLVGALFYFRVDAVSTLLAYIDSATLGLPQVVGGATVKAVWPAAGIMRL